MRRELKIDLLNDDKLTDPERVTYKNRPKCIVMHHTDGPGQDVGDIKQFFETSEGDAHYIVGLKGDVVQCIPIETVAYHAHHGGKVDPASGKFFTDEARERFGTKSDGSAYSPNTKSIGVEMCVIDSDGNFSDETYVGAVDLCAYLCRTFKLDPEKDITTHHNLVGWKDCPRLWTNNPELFEKFKQDVVARIPEQSAEDEEDERIRQEQEKEERRKQKEEQKNATNNQEDN